MTDYNTAPSIYCGLGLVELVKSNKNELRHRGPRNGLETYLHEKLLNHDLPRADMTAQDLWARLEDCAVIAEKHFPALYATKKEKGGKSKKFSKWSSYTGAIGNVAERFAEEGLPILKFYKDERQKRAKRFYFMPHVVAAMYWIDKKITTEAGDE